jgi:translation initiation factor 2 beta subunit (eIF-2beta)/eIF-5
MAIFIENIELQISGKAYSKISEWIDKGYVKKANEIKKNQWNYNLKTDDETFECQIQYSEHSIRTYLCACNQKFQKKACLHVYACALWHKLNIKANKINTQPTLKKKINIEFYQEALYQDGILQFLKKELNRNDKLNQAFQLRYFYLDQAEAKNTFHSILPLTETNPKAKKTSLNTYKVQLQLLTELYEGSVFAVSKSMPIEAIESALHGVLYANKLFVNFRNHQSEQMIRKFHAIIYEIIRSTKEPNLREQLFVETTTCLKNPYYIINSIDENIAQYLYSFYTQVLFKNQVNLILLHKLEECTIEKNISSINLVYVIINNCNDENSVIQYFKSNENKKWLLSLFIDDIINNRRLHLYFPIVQLFLEKLPDVQSEPKMNALIEFAIQKNDHALIKSLSIKALLQLQNLKYAEILVDESHSNSFMTMQELLSLVSDIKYEKLKLEVIHKFGTDEELIQALELCNSDEIIDLYANRLLETKNKWIYNYYLTKSIEILNTFGGIHAYEKIEKITQKIKKYQNEKWLAEFTKDLKSRFPERVAIFQAK